MKKLTAIILTAALLLTSAFALAETAPQTQIEKALALIGTFASSDTELATSLLDENYIQHNTGIADGVSGLSAALSALAEQGISMIYDNVHMVLAQGNYVLAVSEGTFGGVPTSYYDLCAWRTARLPSTGT